MATFDTRRASRVPLIVGCVLLAAAAIVAWDARKMTIVATYGINPTAMPYAVSIFLAALGIGHFIAALRDSFPTPEPIGWHSVRWIGLALGLMLAGVAAGVGFTLSVTALFAFTSRAFGRNALVADLVIGFLLGLVIYLVFTKLLGLNLPRGPLERLV